MHRGFVIAWLIACSSQPTTPRQPLPVAVPSDAGVAVDAAPGAPIAVPGSTRARVEAPHGGSIVTLAVTPDASAAITADELGGIRLWPALDGSAEPRVVDLPRPQRLAIVRDGRDFVVAVVDEVGGLALHVVDPDGLTVRRASLGIEPAFAGVAATSRGLVAWRTDQRILRLASDGRIVAQLVPDPGQRIVAVAVAGERGVAVLETADSPPKRRARWFSLDKLAWDLFLADDKFGTQLALSPSGKRLAHVVVANGRTQVFVVDTQSGKTLVDDAYPITPAIALVDDDHLAVVVNGNVQWIDFAAPKKPPLARNGIGQGASIVGAGGGQVITATSGELVIASPGKLEFLGYELQSPAVAAAAPQGRMLIGLGDSFALLDAKLQAGPAPDLLVPAGSAIADLRWLAGDDWLVETSRVNDGVTAIALVDVDKHKSIPVRSGMAMVQMLMHEPTTQLVTLSLGDQPEVLRHEPGKLRLDRVATLPKPDGFERAQLVPVSPKLAGGTQVVVVHMRDRLTLRWVKDPRALDKGTAVTIDASLAGVDPTGTVFVWQSDLSRTLELAMYRDGKQTGVLPTDGPTGVWPDPRGGQVLTVGQRTIALVDIDGKRKWAQALQGVTEALWLDDGTIGIVSAAGIARLDAKTGELVAARCGWRFGRTTKQHPASPRVESVCSQLR